MVLRLSELSPRIAVPLSERTTCFSGVAPLPAEVTHRLLVGCVVLAQYLGLKSQETLGTHGTDVTEPTPSAAVARGPLATRLGNGRLMLARALTAEDEERLIFYERFFFDMGMQPAERLQLVTRALVVCAPSCRSPHRPVTLIAL